MMEAMLGTRARYDEFAAAGGPWGNIIAFVGHTATPDTELCRLIRAKGARCMAGTSRNLDLEFLRGRVATLEPLQAGYRAVLERGVDVIETDIPRELSPWLNASPPPAGSDKARFFKLGQP
jgi:glycerophosphoryl diester phosphodiesterase